MGSLCMRWVNLVRETYSEGWGSCPWTRGARALLAGCVALSLGGCAITLPMSSLFERKGVPDPLPAAQAQPAATTATAPAEPGSAPVTAAAVFNPADRMVTGSTSARPPTPSPRPLDLSPTATATTGATAPAAAVASMPAGLLPISEADWQVARRSLNEALADRADTPSIAWENEESGARGTVTALQTSISSDGRTCRPFLGSALKQRSENWFEGHACKVGRTTWEIVDIRPWRRN